MQARINRFILPSVLTILVAVGGLVLYRSREVEPRAKPRNGNDRDQPKQAAVPRNRTADGQTDSPRAKDSADGQTMTTKTVTLIERIRDTLSSKHTDRWIVFESILALEAHWTTARPQAQELRHLLTGASEFIRTVVVLAWQRSGASENDLKALVDLASTESHPIVRFVTYYAISAGRHPFGSQMEGDYLDRDSRGWDALLTRIASLFARTSGDAATTLIADLWRSQNEEGYYADPFSRSYQPLPPELLTKVVADIMTQGDYGLRLAMLKLLQGNASNAQVVNFASELAASNDPLSGEAVSILAGANCEKSLELLIRLASSAENPRVRESAVRALKMEDNTCELLAARYVQEESADVRRAILHLLIDKKWRSAEAFARDVLQNEREPEVVCAAIRGISSELDVRRFENELRSLASSNDERIRAAATVALQGIGNSK